MWLRLKWQRWWAMPGWQRRLRLRAAFMLAALQLAVRCGAFRRLVAELQHTPSCPESVALSQAKAQMAAELADAVRRAANNLPWRCTCLAQVLCLQRLLRERDIAGTFFLGVRKQTSAGALAAHAWLVSGDAILSGEEGSSDHTIVSAFSWCTDAAV